MDTTYIVIIKTLLAVIIFIALKIALKIRRG